MIMLSLKAIYHESLHEITLMIKDLFVDSRMFHLLLGLYLVGSHRTCLIIR